MLDLMTKPPKPQRAKKRPKAKTPSKVTPVRVTFDSQNRVKRPQTEKKYQELLRAAARLMAKQGYDDTSIRDVGRATGLSLAGMYFYFESKEDLLYQIQSATFAALLRQIQEAIAGASTPEARLRRIVHGYLDFYVRHTNELRVCTYQYEALDGALYEKVRALRLQMYHAVAAVVSEYMHRKDRGDEHRRDERGFVRHHTLFIFGMLNWLFMWFDPKRDGPIAEVAERMLDMIFAGLPRGRVGARKSNHPG